MKVPTPHPQWIALVLPFQINVWIAVVISVFVVFMFLILYALLYGNPDIRLNKAWLLIVAIIFDESYQTLQRTRYDANIMRTIILIHISGKFHRFLYLEKIEKSSIAYLFLVLTEEMLR